MGVETAAAATAAQGACDTNKKAFALPSLEQIMADLSNKQVSVVVKMNHLFALKELGGSDTVRLLLHALKDKNTVDSVLFRQVNSHTLTEHLPRSFARLCNEANTCTGFLFASVLFKLPTPFSSYAYVLKALHNFSVQQVTSKRPAGCFFPIQ